ncbi:hypothetical protein OSB04_015223 [Centaurea solstitialis]|uniref:Secreted protein n=1 Tax=Centaurea solstitialis TaxID=347529 RepID=A0AA38T6F2_9ASTR|nr:hypothetical protein OSB04_015223 [Centaurea solstitialis]
MVCMCAACVFGWLIDGGQQKAAAAAGVLFRPPAALAVGGGCRRQLYTVIIRCMAEIIGCCAISVTGPDVGCGVTLSSQGFTAIIGCRGRVTLGCLDVGHRTWRLVVPLELSTRKEIKYGFFLASMSTTCLVSINGSNKFTGSVHFVVEIFVKQRLHHLSTAVTLA